MFGMIVYAMIPFGFNGGKIDIAKRWNNTCPRPGAWEVQPKAESDTSRCGSRHGGVF